jgi:hypothetical protein
MEVLLNLSLKTASREGSDSDFSYFLCARGISSLQKGPLDYPLAQPIISSRFPAVKQTSEDTNSALSSSADVTRSLEHVSLWAVKSFFSTTSDVPFSTVAVPQVSLQPARGTLHAGCPLTRLVHGALQYFVCG